MKAGWYKRKIGELCHLATGGTPSRSKPEYFEGGKIRWLVSGDIHRREITDCEGRITELGLQNSNARPLPVNSVIIALNGQGKTRGTVALLRAEATCNQSLVSINPINHSQLSSEFLYWNLHGRYEEIRRMTGDDGNERRGLNMPLIRNIVIPIPPIEEQRRIVAVLDEAFAAIDTATTNAEKNLANSRELFEAAFRERFDHIGNDWVTYTLPEIAENWDYLRRPVTKSDRIPGDIPYYGASGQVDSVGEHLFDDDLLLGSKPNQPLDSAM